MTSKYKLLIRGRLLVDKLIKDNIFIYDVEVYKDKVIVVVDDIGYKKIKKLKRKYKYKVLNRYGIIKIKYLINKYSVFIYALILGIFINVILSNMILDIEIIHSNKRIRNIIRDDLNKYGIKKYRFKKSFKTKEIIIDKILDKETNDIEWLEIEEVGTKYIVRVEQRKKKYKEKSCPLQNIIAKKNAMILDIDAYSGEVVKKKYDYVSKGEVIISGLIHNKEKIVSKKCAKGKVYGEVWYKVEVELPTNYKEEKVTNNERHLIEVSILNKNYPLFNTYRDYKTSRKVLIKSKLLPISLNISNYREVINNSKKYNLLTIDNKAIKIASEKLKNKINNEDRIITKKVLKKYKKNSKIVVEIFFKVKENITDTSSIENIDIEEENNKINKEQ